MPTYAIRHRRDTTANWLAANPILLDGELGYERTDDGRLLCKMGDGVQGADGSVTGTHWVDLPYCSGPAGPSPEFEWSGTSLRIRNPDGTWGEWTDLQGVRGLQGVQGEPGPAAESVPATRSSLGGVMIGDGVDVTVGGCISVPFATVDKAGLMQPDGVTVQADEEGLLSALGGNLLLNTRERITESGTFTAKVTGWHHLWMINGGESGYSSYYNGSLQRIFGGTSGKTYDGYVYLHAGEEIEVIIGAGGVPSKHNSSSVTDNINVGYGGQTRFGTLAPTESNNFQGVDAILPTNYQVKVPGGGQGSRKPPFGGGGSSTFYGAGGGAASNNTGCCSVDSGYQGVIIISWHDPAKAAGPLPTPALLSARRMAPLAVAEPVTVNLYDPETGQGSVWREEDAPAKLAEGLVTEEVWQEIRAARAAEARAAWLVDPETEPERFEMLEQACAARLAETDKFTMPDYPISDETRAQVNAYRKAIRELNHQPGAPWDGGGELTPWPEAPVVEKVQEA